MSIYGKRLEGSDWSIADLVEKAWEYRQCCHLSFSSTLIAMWYRPPELSFSVLSWQLAAHHSPLEEDGQRRIPACVVEASPRPHAVFPNVRNVAHSGNECDNDLLKFLEGIGAELLNQRSTKFAPVVLAKVKYAVSECGRFSHVESRLHERNIAWSMDVLKDHGHRGQCEQEQTLIRGNRKESKNQNMNSSRISLRFRESETDTLGRAWTRGPSPASQSHSDVPKPCRTLCNVALSYRRAEMKCSISKKLRRD